MRVEPGEQLLFHGHPSWRAMLGFHTRGLVIAVLAGVAAGLATAATAGHVQAGWVAVAVVTVFAAGLLRGWLRRAATTYALTDRRLLISRGVLGRQVEEARLERVQNVVCRQSARQRLLRVGSVHFDTGAGYELCFEGIERPSELIRALDGALAGWPLVG